MRHQAQAEKMTRLLLQKPVEFGELEENARIALSVLSDDGWNVQRIGLDLNVTVTTRPLDAPDQAAALEAAELRFAMLRAQVMEQGANQWLSVAAGCLICGILSLFPIDGGYGFTGAAACVGIWTLVKWRIRRKAAK